MKALALTLVGGCLALAGTAFGDIDVTLPDLEVDAGGASASLTVTVAFTGSYDVKAYELDVLLAGRDSATGLTFDGADAAGDNYIFEGNSVGWALYTDTDFELYGDDVADVGTETLADVTKNAITIELAVGSVTVGDVYDVSFKTSSCAVYDGSWAPFDVNWHDGVITIVPEPASAALLAVAGCLGLLRRRRA